MPEEPILNRVKHEVWVTKKEYEEWHVEEARQWEVIDHDIISEKIKIRRIDNVRNRTST